MQSNKPIIKFIKSSSPMKYQKRLFITCSSISTGLSASSTCNKENPLKKQRVEKLMAQRIENLESIYQKNQQKNNLIVLNSKNEIVPLSIFQQKGKIIKNQEIFKQLRTQRRDRVSSIQKRESLQKSNTLTPKSKSPTKSQYILSPIPSEKKLRSLNQIQEIESFILNEQQDQNDAGVIERYEYSDIFDINSFPSRITEFKILKFLDEGKFGKVYLSQSIENGMIYSIKSIYRSSLNQKYLLQLIREVKIQSFLNHPHIVKLYHFFADDDCAYLVLEPCLQKNLYQKLKQVGRLSQKVVKQIIRQVCSAVQYMHKNNIIHRDIKPQNILVHENMVKICDFGWAIHSPLKRNTQCGTPLYTSPEVVCNKYYDNKIDIWSIGVLTYQLLYGTIPFQIRQLSDMVKIIQQQVYFSQSINVSETAKDFMMSCLHKDPKKRFSIHQLLDHEFLSKNDKYRLTM